MQTRYYVQVQTKGDHWETYDAFTSYQGALEELKKYHQRDPLKLWRIMESKPTVTEIYRSEGTR